MLVIIAVADARADGCPIAKVEIATDRPDVTNSSLVVPVGSLQSENGVNLSADSNMRAAACIHLSALQAIHPLAPSRLRGGVQLGNADGMD